MEKLKNGMFVICPDGDVSSYLTNGKKYEVFDVVCDGYNRFNFKIIDDEEEPLICLIRETHGCAHLNDKHWIIDNPEKP